MSKCGRCGARLVCTHCETCPEHCRLGDPVACAREAVEFSEQRFGPDDPRTKTAREWPEEALEMIVKDAAELSAAAARVSRARAWVGSILRGKPI